MAERRPDALVMVAVGTAAKRNAGVVPTASGDITAKPFVGLTNNEHVVAIVNIGGADEILYLRKDRQLPRRSSV